MIYFRRRRNFCSVSNQRRGVPVLRRDTLLPEISKDFVMHAENVRRFTAGICKCALALVLAQVSDLAPAQTIGFYEQSRFTLGSTASNPYGTNPSSVAWGGGKLYVAGLNGSGSTANTGIVQILNVGDTGIVTGSQSAAFGVLSTPSSRGYTGVFLKGNYLGASFDAGSNTATALQGFDTTTNSGTWNLAASGTTATNVGLSRGMARLGYDPGFNADPAQGSGFSWINQGSGRRPTNRTDTGVPDYVLTGSSTPANPSSEGGYIFNNGANSTNFRAMGFDPNTGDFYGITNNQVVKAVRSGANSIVSGTTPLLISQATANNVVTNLAFMDGITAQGINPFSGDALIFNDRNSAANGQSWTNVIKVATTSGATITPTWNFLAAPNTSNGAYDFSWDTASETLAVMDYANRTVSIFTVPEPSSMALASTCIAGLAAMMLRGRRRGPTNS